MKPANPQSHPSRRWPSRLAASSAAAFAALLLGTGPAAHAGLALPADTVAYYAFDNPGNLGLDSSANGNNLINGTGTPTAIGSGEFGAGMSMNSDCYLSLPSAGTPATLNLGTNPYSVSVWIKPTKDNDNAIIHWGAWGAVNIRLDGPQANGNSTLDQWAFGDGNFVVDAGKNLRDGQWHNVVFTYAGGSGNQTFYVDGSQVGTRPIGNTANWPPQLAPWYDGPNPQPNLGFRVGNGGDDWHRFQGSMDDLLVVNHALTQTENTALQSGIITAATTKTITATATPAGGGTISPAGDVMVAPGINQTFTITPAFGYGASVSVTENGSTSPHGAITSYTFSNVQNDGLITATFSALDVSSVAGTVLINGSGTSGATVSVYSNAACTTLLTSVPANGSGVYSVSLPQNNTYYLRATKSGYGTPAPLTVALGTSSLTGQDLAITSIRYEAENAALVGCGITYDAAASASNGARVASWNYGNNATVTFTVNVAQTGLYELTMGYYQPWEGNRDTYLSVNGVAKGTIPALYSATTGASTINNIALVAGDNTIVLSNGSDSWGPHWDYIDVPLDRYSAAVKITSSVDGTGTGTGTILPLGDIYVAAGSSQTFTVTPAFASAIDTVKVNGSPVSAPYTVTPTADSTIVAKFVALPTHTITATAATGGSISPSGSVVVVDGTDQTFTIAAQFGYSLADVVVDSTTHLGAVTSHTFTNNTANHSITASFTDLGGAKLPIGTVAYWPFDNSLTDPVGGNNLEAKEGTVAYGTAKFGSACLQLNGSTRLGTISGLFPTGVPTGANSFTVACFVKADPSSEGNGGWVGWGSEGYDNGTRCINLRMAGYYDVTAYWWASDQGGHVPSGSFTDGWHSVIQTYDATKDPARVMYIDGINVAHDNPAVPNVTNERFEVGKTLADRFLTGWIDDLLILNRAMTADEVTYYNTNGAQLPSGPATIPYSTWASTNAPGQTASEDYNNDGVQNGIAYFMGTGLDHATNPGLNASNNVTWPMSATFSGTYEVQTSPDLGTWTKVTPQPTPSGGNLTYHLPAGLGKQFVRLLVIPN